jgi:hypothetical protein
MIFSPGDIMISDFEKKLSGLLKSRDVTIDSYFNEETVAVVKDALEHSGIAGDDLTDLVQEYLARDYDIAYVLAGVGGVDAAGPAALARLDGDVLESEKAALICILGDMRYAQAYAVVHRLLGTSYNHYALPSLAKIDFKKTVPAIAAQVRQATADVDCEVLIDGKGAHYDNPLLTTLDVVIDDSLDEVGVQETFARLSMIPMLLDKEKMFIAKAIYNTSLTNDAAKDLFRLYSEIL